MQPFASPNGRSLPKSVIGQGSQRHRNWFRNSDYEVPRIGPGKENEFAATLERLRRQSAGYISTNYDAGDAFAAELWADARNRGLPTAHAQALDADVILAAQVISSGYYPTDFCIATSNVAHFGDYATPMNWESIWITLTTSRRFIPQQYRGIGGRANRNQGRRGGNPADYRARRLLAAVGTRLYPPGR